MTDKVADSPAVTTAADDEGGMGYLETLPRKVVVVYIDRKSVV
jgi:hypothetical protein